MPAPRLSRSSQVPKHLGGGSRENLVSGPDSSDGSDSGSNRSLNELEMDEDSDTPAGNLDAIEERPDFELRDRNSIRDANGDITPVAAAPAAPREILGS